MIVDIGAALRRGRPERRASPRLRALVSKPLEQLVVPISVVVETSFLIERHLGPAAEAAFLGSLTTCAR